MRLSLWCRLWRCGVRYALEGIAFITGAAVQWPRDGLGIIKTADETEALAMSLSSNDNVYLVPAFTGLGAPHWDMYARGLLIVPRKGKRKVDKMRRRQLIKGGAAGTLALGAFAAGASAASADEGRGGAIQVHIHGLVGGVLLISMDVAGHPDDLAGAGWDSGLGGVGTVNPLVPGPGPTATSGPVGACYYTAAGKLEGNLVTLQGRSLLTNRPLTTADAEEAAKSDTRADGRKMDATANVKTGEITFSLSPGGQASWRGPAR